MVNPRTKGANAERDAAKWLKLNFKLEHEPQRNLEQVRFGAHVNSTGMDLIGFQPFCFEIKRCETLSLRSWWVQVVASTNEEYPIPVVMFRQNRKKWEFLISAREIGLEKGFIRLQELEFKRWVEKFIAA